LEIHANLASKLVWQRTFRKWPNSKSNKGSPLCKAEQASLHRGLFGVRLHSSSGQSDAPIRPPNLAGI